ncbi:cysteine-rich secretory protein 2-like [Eriocheir sinensis]|uniref:cysteine-rich secretory protein 2-like n=1 Tax=Eriocheir sinensis TaxID=95602 RepID=UPI0021C9F000|nr:cysteine-rich secretory protein 2-like [Eriocheir sinensis]XP_050721133.1 cysteine-rich secretory protein 2-like [Eriocheir sinensis]
MRLGRRWTRVAAVVMVMVTMTLQVPRVRVWRTDRLPKVYGSRLQLRSLQPGKYKVQRRLVHFHNMFRSKVKPQAANMLAMSWSKEVALDAQRWADACQLLVHDNATGRTVDAFGPCGQNIFVSTHQVPWHFAVKTWWLEKDHFTFNGANDLKVVGHYTQLVWHSSHQLGCGLAHCAHAKPRPFFNYVCNYCPIGNFLDRIGRPYDSGSPCSGCQGYCKGRRLCTNSCPYGDLWMNCKELQRAFPDWLCKSKTKEGLERLRSCQATCKCKGKITYP